MTELYHPEEEKRLSRLAACSLAAAVGILAGALILCVGLCFRVNTGNAGWMLRKAVVCSTLGGWIAMALYFWVYRPSRAESRHMAGILAGEKQEYRGYLTVDSAERQLPCSISVRRAALENGGETVHLILDARLARRLPPSGAFVRVAAVRKYITAYEVCDEKDD